MTDFRDLPTDTIFTGRIATMIKEGICRGAFKVPQWELKSGLRLADLVGRKVPAGAERVRPNSSQIHWEPTAGTR